MKLYFAKDDVFCHPLSAHRQHMKDNGIDEMEVFEAIPEKVPGFFYCRHFALVGEKGHCGKECEGYEPKNGKSGCCKHVGSLYSISEKSIKIKL